MRTHKKVTVSRARDTDIDDHQYDRPVVDIRL